jgi:hypothetical protein
MEASKMIDVNGALPTNQRAQSDDQMQSHPMPAASRTHPTHAHHSHGLLLTAMEVGAAESTPVCQKALGKIAALGVE